MHPNSPPASPASRSSRIDRLLDVVARLLARRWLREQEDDPANEPEHDADDSRPRRPLKS